MTTCTRRLEMDAGHRLLDHEGKCRNVHGHRYVFDITCDGPLDGVGRVIDFAKVKHIVGCWIDDHLDHGFIAQSGDPILEFLKADRSKLYVTRFPPTAENLAEHLLQVARDLLKPHGIAVVSVCCYETPNCSATAGD